MELRCWALPVWNLFNSRVALHACVQNQMLQEKQNFITKIQDVIKRLKRTVVSLCAINNKTEQWFVATSLLWLKRTQVLQSSWLNASWNIMLLYSFKKYEWRSIFNLWMNVLYYNSESKTSVKEMWLMSKIANRDRSKNFNSPSRIIKQVC